MKNMAAQEAKDEFSRRKVSVWPKVDQSLTMMY
jgi:hypothetical protein